MDKTDCTEPRIEAMKVKSSALIGTRSGIWDIVPSVGNGQSKATTLAPEFTDG
jgi:hypothetical protein